MPANKSLANGPDWTSDERALIERLDTPEKIQDFLDGVPYNERDEYRSPRVMLRNHRAHCFEGALFAAAALGHHGFGSRVIDLFAVRDHGHVLAVFKENGCWGAIGKSNFTTLQFREPVYRSLRELVMSYFDVYYNTSGEKTLRGYTRPVDLRRFGHLRWETTEEDLDPGLGQVLDALPHTPLLTPAMENALRRVGRRLYQAGMLGANPAGLHASGAYPDAGKDAT